MMNFRSKVSFINIIKNFNIYSKISKIKRVDLLFYNQLYLLMIKTKKKGELL